MRWILLAVALDLHTYDIYKTSVSNNFFIRGFGEERVEREGGRILVRATYIHACRFAKTMYSQYYKLDGVFCSISQLFLLFIVYM